MMQNLMQSNDSSDVTLVCDDKTKLKAHKFVLSACSPVFQSIIADLPQKQDSIIYLRGVFSHEMQSILQFMYLGQATFYQDRMNELLNVAKTLEVKDISKDVDCDTTDTLQNDENNKNIQSNQDNLQIQEEAEKNVIVDTIREANKMVSSVNVNGLYCCERCNKPYGRSSHLMQHIKSVHEGIRYSCKNCNKSYTLETDLNRHIKSVHEGVKYQCNSCESQYSSDVALYKHKKKH